MEAFSSAVAVPKATVTPAALIPARGAPVLRRTRGRHHNPLTLGRRRP
ncbi:MAG TPA: hypothetical protein VF611_12865 [Pyrinomonadaceae bacterium]